MFPSGSCRIMFRSPIWGRSVGADWIGWPARTSRSCSTSIAGTLIASTTPSRGPVGPAGRTTAHRAPEPSVQEDEGARAGGRELRIGRGAVAFQLEDVAVEAHRGLEIAHDEHRPEEPGSWEGRGHDPLDGSGLFMGGAAERTAPGAPALSQAPRRRPGTRSPIRPREPSTPARRRRRARRSRGSG